MYACFIYCTLYLNEILFKPNNTKSEDPDQTAPLVCSGSALFAQACLSENLGSCWYCQEKMRFYRMVNNVSVMLHLSSKFLGLTDLRYMNNNQTLFKATIRGRLFEINDIVS